MSLTRKIYITGCAKSGTTLVRRLFNAFELNVANHDEMALDSFLESEYDVAKRNSDTILSNILNDAQEAHQFPLILDISIVNVIRNKKDVLKSDKNYVSEERYDSCIKQAERFKRHIDFTVIFEDLIKDPDRIQKEVSEKFNLKIVHKWSEYPKFMDGIEENLDLRRVGSYNYCSYQLRPIGAKKITP